jgi:hypothetical protein
MTRGGACSTATHCTGLPQQSLVSWGGRANKWETGTPKCASLPRSKHCCLTASSHPAQRLRPSVGMIATNSAAMPSKAAM